MRHLYPLFTVLLLLFFAEDANAQINFFSLDYEDSYNYDSGYFNNGFMPLSDAFEIPSGF